MIKQHNYYIYIMMSISNTLYIGVTNNLERRVQEHQLELVDGFTKKYKCKKLVYYEQYSHIDDAIKKEKQLKNWKREWKLNLIKNNNPNYDDISDNFTSTNSQMLKQVQHDNTTALFIGRFQPFHLGHLDALDQIDATKILIGIGSSQYSRTEDNPYTYDERKKMIEQAIDDDRVSIMAIPDIHDEVHWPEHVLSLTGPVDIIYSGNEWVRSLFERDGYKTDEIKISKDISGTAIRKKMKATDEAWKKLVPKAIVNQLKTNNITMGELSER